MENQVGVIMGLLKWFERKLFTGDVLEDYGDIQDDRKGMVRVRTRVLLCRRKGRVKLVFGQAGTSPFGGSAYYSIIDVTPETLGRLEKIIFDAKRQISRLSSVR